jgi:hypothetical protein
MKNVLPAVTIITIFLVNVVLEEYPALPARVLYVPDLVLGGIAIAVIPRLVATGRVFAVPLKYMLVFFAFCYVAVAAAILNDVSGQTTFAGIRSYFKYVPLFLMPFAYDYSVRDLKKHFVFFLVLAFLQIPTSLRQRFIVHAGEISGDDVTGTTGESGTLTFFLIAIITMLVALLLGKRISAARALCLSGLFFVPTIINETKVTPILLLVGISSVIYSQRSQIKVSQLVPFAGAAVLMGAIFAGAYGVLYGERSGGYSEVMTQDSVPILGAGGLTGSRIDVGAFKTKQRKDIVGLPPSVFEQGQHGKWVGRFDSIKMPFQAWFPNDMIHLALGLGIGNVTSTFGGGTEYLFIKLQLGGTFTTLTQLIWECGIIGAALFVSFIVLVLRDALSVSSASRWHDFAAGWVGVCVIVLVACIYASLFLVPTILAPFMFYSGLLVSKTRNPA